MLETLRVPKKGGTFAIHDLMSERRYGDMQAFVQKLREMGYERVELIDTTTGKFMPPKEAKRLMSDLLIELSCMQDWPGAQETVQEILKGKVVILCDNSPEALILPGNFSSFMESSEDWYHRFEMASFLRILRYLAVIMATVLPGLYLAVIRFHTQILPSALILSFAEAREGVPFSSVVELIFLELAFELIREAGVRVPGSLGNAIGIVGGLVIGQAAVEANLVSPIVVMIVALTALGSMTVPNEEFAAAFRLVKYGFLILGGYLGIYGIVLGVYLVIGHLAGLISFGIPYLPFIKKEQKGSRGEGVLRVPLRKRVLRPLYAREEQKIRLKRKESGS